jgi:hypothetical protein
MKILNLVETGWYFFGTFGISLICGIIWWWRFDKMKIAEKLHNCIWNTLVQFLGFLFVYFQIYILNIILTTNENFKIGVLGILFLILMFFSVFCLFGRGIQIIQGVLEKGIKEITISWRGIIIKCEEDESNL